MPQMLLTVAHQKCCFSLKNQESIYIALETIQFSLEFSTCMKNKTKNLIYYNERFLLLSDTFIWCTHHNHVNAYKNAIKKKITRSDTEISNRKDFNSPLHPPASLSLSSMLYVLGRGRVTHVFNVKTCV